MYNNIFLALDGSIYSNYAMDIGINLAEKFENSKLIGCHVYTSRMHRKRFEQMEPTLPEKYQTENQLKYLRDTHDDLITDGMILISDAYLAPLIKKTQEKGLKCEGLTPEGKNYVGILKAIREIKPELVLAGAWGHGKLHEDILGSLTQRILLYNTHTDLMIVREPLNFKLRPIIVGIDGSENCYVALRKAIEIAKIYNAKVEAVASYDPFFHSGVFKTIAEVLPKNDKKKFNFVAQEKLHDEIIDKGLEKLYYEGLQKAELLADSLDYKIHIEILTGKVFSKILQYAALRNACLVVIGRWGLHKEKDSLIGSNSFNIAMLCKTNVLIATKNNVQVLIPELPKIDKIPLKWTSDAEKITEKIPKFVRNMAKNMIEDYARERGFSEVIPEIVKEVGEKFGMEIKSVQKKNSEDDSPKYSRDLQEIREANLIIFKKIKKLAPNFHRHILQSKIIGQVVNVGEKILVYKVLEIKPVSPALVTKNTILEFK
ncbi:MAG: universal stress protein [Promethearchaeota archaeon]